MIVYAERRQRIRSEFLLNSARSAQDSMDSLMLEGQWESGVLDALCPDADDVIDLSSAPLPEYIDGRPQEGFAYYALYPDQYRDAALRYFGEKQPAACVVIGIRSIGTVLSKVVADALPCPAVRFTVRPRGHPFDRKLVLAEGLQALIREHAHWPFLVVDEGPGLSGSSFTSVAECLNGFGVSDENIIFFPSHDADYTAFVSERARERWPRHAKYVEPFHADRYVPAGYLDLSGGRWRELLGIDAAVQPSHERRKYLHDGRLWKFAGLGHYGRAKLDRARQLAGFIPPALGFESGFLISEWVPGTPASGPTPDLIANLRRYIDVITVEFDTGKPADPRPLAEMIRTNLRVEPEPAPSCGNAIALDARMLPHEWIETERGWLKADALDHHDDHFYPGCTDVAWDVASAALEFGIAPDLLTNDEAVLKRIPFFTQAYRAFRFGYCTMAEQALSGTEEGARFAALKQRYG